MPRLFLLDGFSLAFRAFYAIDVGLSTKDGRPTNAIYGFALMLNKLIEHYKPEYMVAAFDRGQPVARLERYAAYKAQRPKAPEELSQQMDSIKELLAAFGCQILEVEGYEADDVIGTLTARAEQAGIQSVIVTSDRDSLQLVSPHVKVLLTKKGVSETELVGESEVRAKYGLAPAQLIELKAFMGDPSDNIKGVKGIGEKTALALVQEFHSVQGVYDNIANVSKVRVRELLQAGQEDAMLSKFLATIVRDVAFDFAMEGLLPRETDVARLAMLYREVGLSSLLSRLLSQAPAPLPPVNDSLVGEVVVAKTAEDLTAYIAQIDTARPVALFKSAPHFFVLATGNRALAVETLGQTLPPSMERLLADPRLAWVVSGYKELLVDFNRRGLTWAGEVFDIELATYLLDPTRSSYSVGELVTHYLDKTMADDAQAFALLALEPVLRAQLIEKELIDLYSQVELPLSRVLAAMEITGIAVDSGVLREMAWQANLRLKEIVTDIYVLAGEEFNISSPKQLGVILFEKLKLPTSKKTKTGYSTDADVLESLADQHPLVGKILEHRTLAKLHSTYLEGLQKVISPVGRIHTTYNQTVTATGRLSSTEPNLQNIPIRLPEGRLIRKAFKPGAKFTHILAADYSQIELRILAHLSKDPILTAAFLQGEDVHRRTAAEVFGVSLDEVTPSMRGRAKAVNFGIVYGISDYGLSRDIKVSRAEAKAYIDNYFKRYRGVKEYIERTIAEARATGFVTTLLHRRRFLPDINSKNFTLRSFAERTAMNTPIQGTAADLIKLAMVKIASELKLKGLCSRMILQVHDELVFETTEAELSFLAPLVCQAMETALTLNVPLQVDFKVGLNWYDLRPLTMDRAEAPHA